MTARSRLKRWEARLYSRRLLFGGWLRRNAGEALLRSRSPEAAMALVRAALQEDDPLAREIALGLLRRLEDRGSIDQVCAAWAKTRSRHLRDLLAERAWAASGPPAIRVLSILGSGKLEPLATEGPEVVEPLLEASRDPDPEIARRSRRALEDLRTEGAREMLCELAIDGREPLAREVALKSRLAPRDPARRALFFFLTEQWREYESLDFDRSLLRAAYQAGDERLRERIAARARKAGRGEWVEVVSGGRKGLRLAEMTDAEWEVALAVLISRKGWEELWRLAQEAPARWSGAILRTLKVASWTPPGDGRLGFEELAKLAEGWVDPDLSALVRPTATLEGHSLEVSSLEMTPDGSLLASGSLDKTVRLWSLPEGSCRRTIEDHTSSVECLAMGPRGRLLASGGGPFDKTVKVWRLPEGKALSTFKGHKSAVTSLAFAPDGRILASGSFDRTARLWDLRDEVALATLQGHRGPVTSLAVSPDGRVLASSSRNDRSLRLWSLPDGGDLRTLEGHKDDISCLAVSPDGRILASGSFDTTIRLWRLPEGELLATLEGHRDGVSCLAVSPDGRVLASGSFDSTVRLWRLADGKLIETLQRHTSFVKCIAMSADGRLLASAGGGGLWSDPTVRLWSLPRGKPLKPLKGHSHWISCLALSPDGQILASGGQDRAVRLWGLEPLRLLHLPVRELSDRDGAWIESALAQGLPSPEERLLLEYTAALLRFRSRFDIEIDEAPLRLAAGEFDIEIEG